jgi:hypothetical protein
VGLGLHLLEQPGVLDCNHCLVRKGLQKFDLSFGKRPYFGARKRQHARGDAIPQHRDSKHRSKVTEFLSLEESVFIIGQRVRKVNDPPLL